MAQGKLQWSSVGVGHACCCCRVALTALPPHGCAVAVPCERGADAASVKRSETGMSNADNDAELDASARSVIAGRGSRDRR
jgi:hypothetical protein